MGSNSRTGVQLEDGEGGGGPTKSGEGDETRGRRKVQRKREAIPRAVILVVVDEGVHEGYGLGRDPGVGVDPQTLTLEFDLVPTKRMRRSSRRWLA